MALIDKVRTALQQLLQKHNRNMITPDELNSYAGIVQGKMVRQALDYIDSISNRQKLGRAGKIDYDKLQFNRNIVRQLLANTTLTYSDPNFDFPTDYMLCQEVYYGGNPVEEISPNERVVVNMLEPSELYPVYMEHSTYIEIIPDTIDADVTMYYYKQPDAPKWTYTTVSSVNLFNPDASDFVDFSLPESVLDEIVNEMAVLCGVQLKQPDVVQVFSQADDKSEQLKREQ